MGMGGGRERDGEGGGARGERRSEGGEGEGTREGGGERGGFAPNVGNMWRCPTREK